MWLDVVPKIATINDLLPSLERRVDDIWRQSLAFAHERRRVVREFYEPDVFEAVPTWNAVLVT